MCRPATCKTCGKVTWAGCGMHVNQVMAGVPHAARCPGHPKSNAARNSGTGRVRSWLRGVLGR